MQLRDFLLILSCYMTPISDSVFRLVGLRQSRPPVGIREIRRM